MKIYLILISVIFTTFSYTLSQKKELSLKDAVMLQRSLSPERITNFLWISDTEYSTCSKDWKTLFKNNVNADKDVELLKIENLKYFIVIVIIVLIKVIHDLRKRKKRKLK